MQVFSCEICEILKNISFYRTPPAAASAVDAQWSSTDFQNHSFWLVIKQGKTVEKLFY